MAYTLPHFAAVLHACAKTMESCCYESNLNTISEKHCSETIFARSSLALQQTPTEPLALQQIRIESYFDSQVNVLNL